MDTSQYGFLPYVPSTLTEYALLALVCLDWTCASMADMKSRFVPYRLLTQAVNTGTHLTPTEDRCLLDEQVSCSLLFELALVHDSTSLQ